MDDICPHCQKSFEWKWMEPVKISGSELPPRYTYICPHCKKPFVENVNPEKKRLKLYALLLVLPVMMAMHFKSLPAKVLTSIPIVLFAVYAYRQKQQYPKAQAKYRRLDR